MTTIILTIIGILLAAAAALMVIFYGGEAFNSGGLRAQMNEYRNYSSNIRSAIVLFKAEQGRLPFSIGELYLDGPNGRYMQDLELRYNSIPTFAYSYNPTFPHQIRITLGNSSNPYRDRMCEEFNKLGGRDPHADTLDGKIGCLWTGRVYFENL